MASQLLAVAVGGALHQDLPSAGHPDHHWEEGRQYEPVHEVVADARYGGVRRRWPAPTKVNSIHHQAVREPGADLTRRRGATTA